MLTEGQIIGKILGGTFEKLADNYDDVEFQVPYVGYDQLCDYYYWEGNYPNRDRLYNQVDIIIGMLKCLGFEELEDEEMLYADTYYVYGGVLQ